ncbi:MAG: PilZ domain-containing protein [Acetivibrionales bacterium]|jgi:regulator of sigma D
MSQKLRFDEILDLYTIVETKMKNKKNWEKTVVLNIHNDYLEVCQIEEYVTFALMIGDTLECRVVTNDSIILMSTLVYNIKLVSNSIVLKILKVEKYDNARKHRRYEVTCSGTFRKIDDIGEKYTIVNNVSLCGMSIITRDKLHKGDNIEVNIKYSNDCFVTAECTVMWVTQSEQNYFCGLSITYMDESNKEIYRSLIKKLQSKEQRKKQKLKQGANISLRAKD